MLLLKGCKFQEGFNFLVHTTNTCIACGLTHPNKRKIFVIEGKKEQINLVEELKRNYVILNEIIYMTVHFDIALYECCCSFSVSAFRIYQQP